MTTRQAKAQQEAEALKAQVARLQEELEATRKELAEAQHPAQPQTAAQAHGQQAAVDQPPRMAEVLRATRGLHFEGGRESPLKQFLFQLELRLNGIAATPGQRAQALFSCLGGVALEALRPRYGSQASFEQLRDELRQRFMSEENVELLYAKLLDVRQGGDTADRYGERLAQAADRLQAAGREVPIQERVQILRSHAHPDVAAAARLSGATPATWGAALEQLRAAEAFVLAHRPSTPVAAAMTPAPRAPRPVKCWACGEVGHRWRKCPTLRPCPSCGAKHPSSMRCRGQARPNKLGNKPAETSSYTSGPALTRRSTSLGAGNLRGRQRSPPHAQIPVETSTLAVVGATQVLHSPHRRAPATGRPRAEPKIDDTKGAVGPLLTKVFVHTPGSASGGARLAGTTALLDTGAAVNLVAGGLVRELGLQTRPRTTLRLQLADGRTATARQSVTMSVVWAIGAANRAHAATQISAQDTVEAWVMESPPFPLIVGFADLRKRGLRLEGGSGAGTVSLRIGSGRGRRRRVDLQLVSTPPTFRWERPQRQASALVAAGGAKGTPGPRVEAGSVAASDGRGMHIGMSRSNRAAPGPGRSEPSSRVTDRIREPEAPRRHGEPVETLESYLADVRRAHWSYEAGLAAILPVNPCPPELSAAGAAGESDAPLSLEHLSPARRTEVEAALGAYRRQVGLADSQSGAARGRRVAGVPPFRVHLREDAQPLHIRARRYTPDKREAMEAQIDQLLADGRVVEASQLAPTFVSPVLMIRKKQGTWRMCVDYTALNKALRPASFPLPRIEELVAKLRGAKFITTLDLESGYWQVGVHPDTRPHLAFTDGRGVYTWTVMPFGPSGAPAHFQRVMSALLANHDGVLVYLDDVVIYATTFEEHMQRLSAVLTTLGAHGLRLNMAKCKWLRRQTIVLGLTVDGDGVQPNRQRVAALLDMPEPRTRPELQAWMGLANYYRPFVPKLAQRVSAIQPLLAKGAEFKWAKQQRRQWRSVNRIIANLPRLGHPDPTRILYVFTDACDTGVGAAVEQVAPEFQDGSVSEVPPRDRMRPVAFFSKSLDKVQRRWSTFEREAWAVIATLHRFRHLVRACRTVVVTDHKALTALFSGKGSSKVHRWATTLAEYQVCILHRPGVDHGNADGLSRLPVATVVVAPATGGRPQRRRQPSERLRLARESEVRARQTSSQAQPAVRTGANVRQPSRALAEADRGARAMARPHWEVGDITAARLSPEGDIEYKVQWSGHWDPTWEPRRSLDRCPALLSRFEQSEQFRRVQLEQERLFRAAWRLGRGDSALDAASSQPEALSLLVPPPHEFTATGRVVVPEERRQAVLEFFHDTTFGAHAGPQRMLAQASRYFAWDGLRDDVRQYTSSCSECSARKPGRRVGDRMPLVRLRAGRPFEEVVIDHVGPLPTTAAGYRYILTVVDRFTRYAVAVPLKHLTAVETARGFLEHVVLRFGAPQCISSDGGAAFRSGLFRALADQFRVVTRVGTPYYPRGHGLVERLHRTLHEAISAFVGPLHDSWDRHLHAVMFGLNSLPCRPTGFSPFELVHTFRPFVPGLFPVDGSRPGRTNGRDVVAWARWLARAVPKRMALARLAQDRYLRGEVVVDVARPAPDAERVLDGHPTGSWVSVGSLVYRWLDPSRRRGPSTKYQPRYDGPWRVVRLAQLGRVAYLVDAASSASTADSPIEVSVHQLKKVGDGAGSLSPGGGE